MRRRVSRTLVLVGALVALLLVGSNVLADGVDAGSFVRDGAGSRALGLGGAFTAVADDASAALWNPAGLLQVDGANLLAMYTNKFGLDIAFQYLAASLHVGSVAFGAGLVRSSIDDIPYYGDEGEGFFSEVQSLFLASLAYDVGTLVDLGLDGRLSLYVGVNGRAYGHSILEGRARGLGFDISVLGKCEFDWGTLGVGYASTDTLGTTIQWSGTDHDPTNDVPWTHKIGASVRFLEDQLLAAADVDLAVGRPNLDELHLGVEYSPVEVVTARAGLVVGKDGVSWSAGGSIHWGGFVLDYAFIPHAALGDSHVLSLGYEIPAWWGDQDQPVENLGAPTGSPEAAEGGSS